MEKLKSELKTLNLKICGEEDRIRGDKISIAPLEISKQARGFEKLEEIGHHHRREDVVKIFSSKPGRTVSYKKIFKVAGRRAGKNAETRTSTKEAKSQYINFHSNLVFISGHAGIGKSTLSKEIVKKMLEDNKPLYGAEFVFFIRFRDLDYTTTTYDLLQFLTTTSKLISDISNDEERRKIVQHLAYIEHVYIVMDGFDEADIDLQLQHLTCDETSTTTAEVFIFNLLSGHILPKSKKIVTSRPRQLLHLPDNFSSSFFLNLLGLSEKGQEQICSDICQNDLGRKAEILEDINSRPDLKSLCYVPINCIMVMMSFFLISSTKKKNLHTFSDILINVLQEWFLKKLKGEFQTKEISALAYKGFQSGQYLFKKFDLKTAKINLENTTAFLANNLKFQLLQGKAVTFFCHLIWQEFFVAVKLRLYSRTSEFKTIYPELGSDKYEVVTRCLFGLCKKNTLTELLGCIENENFNTESDLDESKKLLEEFAIKKLRKHRDSKKLITNYFRYILPVFGWLREMEDDEFTKQAVDLLRDEFSISDGDQILPSDIFCINYALRFREKCLSLHVKNPKLVGNCLRYFLDEFHSTLLQNPNIRVSLQSHKLNTNSQNNVVSRVGKISILA